MSGTSAPTAPDDPSPVLERAHRTARTDEADLAAVHEEQRGELYACLRLVREALAGHMPDDVRPWLHRVASNAAIDRARRGARFARLVPRLPDRREPAQPEGEALRLERNAELRARLGCLAPDRRAALLLAARGFTGHEVGSLLGRSEAGTRTLLRRARVELRAILEAAEVRP